jgi:chemotaxis protein CheD
MAKIDLELPEVYLQPGEVHLARRAAILKTVLGSCVGVTFWNPRLHIGALCHGALPRCPAGMQAPAGYRYVDFAICDLARHLANLGIQRDEVQVKVFGGADVLPVHAAALQKTTVGYQNCRAALEALEREGLVVLASDLGGLSGRVIQFHTGTGQVLLRRLSQIGSEEDPKALIPAEY